MFLGHNQNRGPRISVRRAWEPVFTDISGTRIPFDLLYEGIEAYVTVEFSRYNFSVLRQLQTTPTALSGADPLGGIKPFLDTGFDRGTLMLTEGVNVALYLQFPFSAAGPFTHPAMNNAANGPIPSGLLFPGAIFEGPDEMETGTAPLTTMVTFHCLGLYTPVSGGTGPGPGGSFTLASTNIGTLPSIN